MISELFGLATRGHVASSPVWTKGEFDDLVAGSAPRRFAIVQRDGCGLDLRIAAWGMILADRAEIVTVEGQRLTVTSAESAVSWFDRGPDFTAHLVWVDPAGAPTGPALGLDDQTPTVDVPFDGIAGVGVRVQPWRAANGRRFVGLTFASALAEQSHDLTPGQAISLRDALTETIVRLV